MNEFVYDVMNRAASSAQKLKLIDRMKGKDVVVIADEHQLSYLLCGTLMILKSRQSGTTVSLVIEGKLHWPEVAEPILSQWPELIVYNSLDSYLKRRSDRPQLIFDFANLRSDMYDDIEKRKAKLQEIQKLQADCEKYRRNRYQLVTCIPAIDEFLPHATHAVAEREYEVVFRDKPDDSLEKYVVLLEDCIRSKPELLNRIQVTRIDRVYGPGIFETDSIWVNDVIDNIFIKKYIKLYERDRHDIASAAYVRDALLGILVAMFTGRMGNIYHVSSHSISRFQIVTDLLATFPECECRIETVHEGWNNLASTEYRMLNARKLRLAHSSKLDKVLTTAVSSAVADTARWYQNIENFIPTSNTNVYYGRMPRIREIELDILNEVDEICKKNGINYFLTAGTMLGAVRHKGFIPWDDDVDIGMLPEDYYKFLEVCPEHLSIDYGYQNYKTETTSHYIHDKIRVKNSFFSTKYSDKYPMMNGVYIDIFVYFKTSNIHFIQKFHLWYINAVRRLIGIRWANRPRKGYHYHLSLVLIPLMRLFPFRMLHEYYIHVISLFEKRKTRFRVDSMGFNLKKVGAVPDEWFHGTTEAEFCGRKYPILLHYDDFLCHWYGKKYMELLPVSSRKSVHDVVRIDLGQALFKETMHDTAFRNVDIRGELFEKRKQTTEGK